MTAARDGNDEALARLVQRYHDKVYRYGVRVCRDRFDAEDAVQDAFTALSRRPDVQQGGSALAWLFTVVRNACRRLLRPFLRERRSLGERAGDPDEVAVDEGTPERMLERWRLVRAVHESIAALDPGLREVIIMRDLEGMSAPEVSAALALTEEAVKSRLHRARNKLRELVRKHQHDAGLH